MINYSFTSLAALQAAYPYGSPWGMIFSIGGVLYVYDYGTRQFIVAPTPQIPQNPQGLLPSITVGTVTVGVPGSAPSVTIDSTSTASHVILNFVIPAGIAGATGATGAQGATGATPTLPAIYYTEPSTTAQTYAAATPIALSNGITTNAAITENAGTFTFVNAGTYNIYWNVAVASASGATAIDLVVGTTHYGTALPGTTIGEVGGGAIITVTAGTTMSLQSIGGTITTPAPATHASISIVKIA